MTQTEPLAAARHRRQRPTPLLQLEKVSKRFGAVQALTDVDFEVHAGEVVALVGDNGAGKSTLAKTMAGTIIPDEGRIVFDGQPVQLHGPSDATDLGIATVYQDLALCDNLDVVANLYLGREPIGPHGHHRRDRRWRPTSQDAARPALDQDPERAHAGGVAVGRAAPVDRRRPGGHGRAAGGAARRAHRRARRRPDRPGPRADPAPCASRAWPWS